MCLVVAVLAIGSAAQAGMYSTTFSEFNTGWFWQGGSAQHGWSGNGTSGTSGSDSKVDAEIVNLNGNNVFRLSNATTSGNYGYTHAAAPKLDLAGESGTGAVNRQFQYSFDFKSASANYQNGLNLTCPTGWQADTASRHALLYVYDDATNGFSVGFWGTDASGGFVWTQLATNLSRTAWHNLSVTVDFVEGANNDVVSVALNGNTIAGLTTWEQYYRNAGSPQPNTAGIDTVIFRAAGTPVESVRGGGVYFDNLSMTSAVPEPATMAILGLGSLSMLFGRRRKA